MEKQLTYLSPDDLKSIITVELGSKRLEHVRDVFVFSCLTGLIYADITRLSQNNIYQKENQLYIRIEHIKTKLEMNIPLEKISISILSKYQNGSSFKLPIISQQKFNLYLKEIAQICNIAKNLTFTTAHSTFAVLMLFCGYSKYAVSNMLGHQQIKSMKMYKEALIDAIL